MAKFKVLRRIEHNQRLYVPKGQAAPERVKSFGQGQEIAVDAGGFIELSDKEAAPLTAGQVEPAGSSAEGGAHGPKRAEHE